MDEFNIVEPDPEKLLESARSFGYSIETAICDLIDNSIAASASEIRIYFAVESDGSFMKLVDNGCGMNNDELVNSMKFGSLSPGVERQSSDLGRYGLGLKTASFSQARRLTVRSRKEKCDVVTACWDLDLIASSRRWILLRSVPEDESRISDLETGYTGTVVLWQKLDRLLEDPKLKISKDHFYRKVESIKKSVSLIFHKYLEKGIVRISINDEEIKSLSPFDISDRFPSMELQEEKLVLNDSTIVVQPFILPHEAKLDTNQMEKFHLIDGAVDHQGIYLYRNERLIIDGSWLDLGIRKKESQRLCRVAIYISNRHDEVWQIDLRKSSAKVPDVIRKRLEEICKYAVDRSVKVYTHRGVYTKRKKDESYGEYVWSVRAKGTKRVYEPNLNHPIVKHIGNLLGENRKIFENYLKVVSQSIPIGFIVSDFSDASLLLKDVDKSAQAEYDQVRSRILESLLESGISFDKAQKIIDGII